MHLGKFWDIFKASPSKESGPRPCRDGVLTDLEGDRASSDSLEVKACRPTQNPVVSHSSMLFWCIWENFGIFSRQVPLKNQDPDPVEMVF